MTDQSISTAARKTKLADGFTTAAWHGALPLLVWAAHFLVSYASAEVACVLHLDRFRVLGVSATNLWLWTITAAAIALLIVLTGRAMRYRRAEAESGATQALIQMGAAVLALVGVLWSAVPIIFVHGPAICASAP